jgi:hypothetical protein
MVPTENLTRREPGAASLCGRVCGAPEGVKIDGGPQAARGASGNGREGRGTRDGLDQATR